MKRFSDFADEPEPLEGDKLRVQDIINEEIKITGYDIKNSRYDKNRSGKYLTIQFVRQKGDDPNVLFTGSDVLIEQLEKYGDEIPFLTTIRQINRYYTLS